MTAVGLRAASCSARHSGWISQSRTSSIARRPAHQKKTLAVTPQPHSACTVRNCQSAALRTRWRCTAWGRLPWDPLTVGRRRHDDSAGAGRPGSSPVRFDRATSGRSTASPPQFPSEGGPSEKCGSRGDGGRRHAPGFPRARVPLYNSINRENGVRRARCPFAGKLRGVKNHNAICSGKVDLGGFEPTTSCVVSAVLCPLSYPGPAPPGTAPHEASHEACQSRCDVRRTH